MDAELMYYFLLFFTIRSCYQLKTKKKENFNFQMTIIIIVKNN